MIVIFIVLTIFTIVSSVNEGAETECGCGQSRAAENIPNSDSGRILTEGWHGLGGINVSTDMVFIEGGDGFIGTDRPIMHRDGEGPRRAVKLSPYLLDRYEVSNEGLFE